MSLGCSTGLPNSRKEEETRVFAWGVSPNIWVSLRDLRTRWARSWVPRLRSGASFRGLGEDVGDVLGRNEGLDVDLEVVKKEDLDVGRNGLLGVPSGLY